jgi:hypothetical protein
MTPAVVEPLRYSHVLRVIMQQKGAGSGPGMCCTMLPAPAGWLATAAASKPGANSNSPSWLPGSLLATCPHPTPPHPNSCICVCRPASNTRPSMTCPTPPSPVHLYRPSYHSSAMQPSSALPTAAAHSQEPGAATQQRRPNGMLTSLMCRMLSWSASMQPLTQGWLLSPAPACSARRHLLLLRCLPLHPSPLSAPLATQHGTAGRRHAPAARWTRCRGGRSCSARAVHPVASGRWPHTPVVVVGRGGGHRRAAGHGECVQVLAVCKGRPCAGLAVGVGVVRPVGVGSRSVPVLCTCPLAGG